ncbi:unnamed protein product, partial [Medioppia subpectinata]
MSCKPIVTNSSDPTVDHMNHHFRSDLLLPTIQVILLVNPYNKASVLPFSLGSIERQLYPKHLIKVWIKTELLTSDLKAVKGQKKELFEEMLDMNAMTVQMLRKWIRDNRKQYNDMELVLGHESLDGTNNETKYWTTDRFKHLIEMKSFAVEMSRQNWAHFALVMDSDVVLTHNEVFAAMTAHEDMIAMAPMLYSLGTYSNFWAGITEKGYYERTEDYLPILERQRLGWFVVPMIHSCLFINIRHKKSFNLTFDSRDIAQEVSPFDDIIAFAKSAKINAIDLRINNEEVWGYIPPPIETMTSFKSIEQDLIDLQLESLVEGPEFPIASSLTSYISDEKSGDKLDVDHIYVINLVRRPERRQRMIKCLNILGIEAQIWDAIDGKQLDDKSVESLGVHSMDGYLDPYHKRPITFGEIGCFLSHYNIWQDMVRRNLSKAIILEDDVRFERDFKNRWRKALSKFDTKTHDFLYLGRKIQDSKNETLFNDVMVEPNYSYWTVGYLITGLGAH